MRRLLMRVTVMIVFVVAGMVMAQEGDHDPADNWCFDGGLLAGRCTTNDEATTSWMWHYGFYRAQLAKGAITIQDVPVDYRVGMVDLAYPTADAIRDADGNIIAGLSTNFQGAIMVCRSSQTQTEIDLAWVGLDIAGDRVEISTPDGSASANTYVAPSGTNITLKINDGLSGITPGGTMRVYYRGVLIGESDLNGLNRCVT